MGKHRNKLFMDGLQAILFRVVSYVAPKKVLRARASLRNLYSTEVELRNLYDTKVELRNLYSTKVEFRMADEE